jgi:nitroreductase
MLRRATGFYEEMRQRHSVRDFSPTPVARDVIEQCLLTAGSAPSGANMQPWSFVVVSDPAVKCRIRERAEREEYAFYHGLAGDEWLSDLTPLGTDDHKPFLETAPYLIVVFAQPYGLLPSGDRKKHYYVQESVGIATGMLIAALHHAGLGVLTYTPSRMGFLRETLSRPDNERPFLILVVGHPAEDATAPVLTKKTLQEFATFVDAT